MSIPILERLPFWVEYAQLSSFTEVGLLSFLVGVKLEFGSDKAKVAIKLDD